MAQKKVRFAVVGVRGLGRAHLEAIQKNSDIADVSRSKWFSSVRHKGKSCRYP